MLTESAKLRMEYEQTRLERYSGIKRGVVYAPEDLRDVYILWVTASSGNREREWDNYCDLRDQVPRGTNWRIRRKRMESRFH